MPALTSIIEVLYLQTSNRTSCYVYVIIVITVIIDQIVV